MTAQQIWVCSLALLCVIGVVLAQIEWRILPGRATRPPTLAQAFWRRLLKFQLQRPALLPVLVAIAALLIELAMGRWRPPFAEPPRAELISLAESFALGMLTVFAFLAGMVAGFTFVIIGTLGSGFTPQLSDPAIRAPRFWLFLAFSLAGICTSVELLVAPPVIREVFLVPIFCLIGALFSLAAHLHGVALNADPATLVRRLTDNDQPPVGFEEWGRGRPIQVGLAIVRAALTKRDGPTAANVTREVVRACSHFQGELLRMPRSVLENPASTWGVEYIAGVESELQQWVDELESAHVFTPAAFEAAGELLSFPLVWEATLVARLDLRHRGEKGEADLAETDLAEPVRLLLGTRGTRVERPEPENLVRRLTLRAATMHGAFTTFGDTLDLARCEASHPRRRVKLAQCVAIEADIIVTATRLAVDYASHLHELSNLDRYEQHLIETANAGLVRQFGALHFALSPGACSKERLLAILSPATPPAAPGLGNRFLEQLRAGLRSPSQTSRV